MKFILEFIAVISIGVLPSLLATFLHLRSSDYLKKAEQFSVFETLLSTWVRYLGSIAIVLLVAYQQPGSFASVGIRLNERGTNVSAIFIGYFGICFFMILVGLGQRIILRLMKQPSPPAIDTANPWVMDSLRYQTIWERLANLTVLPFSAISEDLIYRGYLVLFLGRLTNTFILWAVISIFLTAVAHLYQGRNSTTVIIHFLIASFFTGLTILTQNVLAPIMAHICFNLINQLKLWSLAKKQDQPISMINNSKDKSAYAVFVVTNVIVLIVSTLLVLA